MVSDNSQAVIERYRTDYPSKDLYLTPFFGGNQYFLFVREIYTDVRLVGTPPSSIGKFGGETDNWMWPRHTCDFSVFRVYAAPDGKTPAEYSKDNVPYQAPTHLKVSTKGYKEGDFAMIMGFPGRTQRFMTSWEIDQLLEYENPNRIFVRGERQDVLKKFMAESDEVRIKYASKYAVSSNYWKNSIGKNRGVRKLGLKSQREALETEFTTWAKGTEYAQALPLIREAVEERTLPASESQLMGEIITGAEVLLYALNLGLPLTGNNRNIAEITEKASTLYKDYDAATDRAVSRVMLKILMDSVPEVIPAALEPHKAHLADYIHDNSVFASQDKFNAYLAAGDYSNLVNDPAFMLAKNINDVRRELTAKTNAANEKFTRGHRLLIAGLAKMSPEKPYYPDANSTLRLTYGNILSYSPADAVKYNYQTHLAGVIEKYDPTNLVDFDIPERLKQLYEEGNNPPTCFIANTDITGGNSGSPVLNARGELIGIAFDGNWDAMSSDVAFEPVLQRTISVDIRYVLFIISKFANSQHIIKELDFN